MALPITSWVSPSISWAIATGRKRSGATPFDMRPDIVEAHRALAGVAIHRNDPAGLAQEADQIIASNPQPPMDISCALWPTLIAKITPAPTSTFASLSKRSRTMPTPTCSWAICGWRKTNTPKRRKLTSRPSIRIPNSSDALGGVLNAYLVQKQPDRALAAARAQLPSIRRMPLSHHARRASDGSEKGSAGCRAGVQTSPGPG